MTSEEMTAGQVSGEFCPRRRATVAHVEIDGEYVLYDEATSALHVLNPTAGVIWLSCDGSASVDGIVSDLAEAFGLTEADIRDDVLGIVAHFEEQGVLESAPSA